MRLLVTTKQEAFDWAVEYFRQVRFRCATADGGGRYMTPNGHRCVIGSMLEVESRADEQILLSFFGSIQKLMRDLKVDQMIPDGLLDFLSEIQPIHDTPTNWSREGLNEAGWSQLLDTAVGRDIRVSLVAQAL